jgi:3-hydroxybutyryl-CoA dehydrogenase
MNVQEPPAWPRRVAVVGAGRMGGGIAEAFAAAGLDVRVTDATPELAQRARERVIARARGHVEAGLLAEEALERAERVEAADGPAEAVDGADLVLEAVAEDSGVKLEVHAAIEAAAPEDAVIATNTSSLDVDRLKEAIERRGRFLGMHWFNPPEWTPGVEVVPVEETDPQVVERVVEFLTAIGKRPAVVSPSVGFIANRLQMALLCEAVRCVEEGLAEPAAIDEVVRSCFGFRLPFFGPFQIADMAGLDVYRAVAEQHRDAFGERFFVPEQLERLVAEGDTGTASGAGFYAYEDADSLQSERDRRYAALAELLGELPPQRFSRRPRPGP